MVSACRSIPAPSPNFLILSAAILYGLYWSAKHRKEALHAGVLAFVFLLIGYSSFFMLVIRFQC